LTTALPLMPQASKVKASGFMGQRYTETVDAILAGYYRSGIQALKVEENKLG
jgi:hypothetical protein